MNNEGEKKLEDFGARRVADHQSIIKILRNELERSEVQKHMMMERLLGLGHEIDLDGVPFWEALAKYRLEQQFIKTGTIMYRNLMGGVQEKGDFMASAYELLLFNQEQERNGKVPI